MHIFVNPITIRDVPIAHAQNQVETKLEQNLTWPSECARIIKKLMLSRYFVQSFCEHTCYFPNLISVPVFVILIFGVS